jgi:hypothetical protein
MVCRTGTISWLVLASAIVLATGCTYRAGHFNPNTQFAYPNSNIKTLGPVKAEVKKTTWIVRPELKLDDIKGCYNEALAQASGANILVNYSEDTYFTAVPFLSIFTVRYVIQGEAAAMTIGQQELR